MSARVTLFQSSSANSMDKFFIDPSSSRISTHFLQLPNEIMCEIFSGLDSFDRYRVGRVNRRLRRIIHDKGDVYRRIAIVPTGANGAVRLEVTFPNGDRLDRTYIQEEDYNFLTDRYEVTGVESHNHRQSGKDYCNRTRAVKYFKDELTNVVKEALENILSNAARIDEVHVGKAMYTSTLLKYRPNSVKLLAAPLSVELATVCRHLQIKSLIIVESQNQTGLKNQWSIMPKAEDSDAEMNEHDQYEIWRNIAALPNLRYIHSLYTMTSLTPEQIFQSKVISFVLSFNGDSQEHTAWNAFSSLVSAWKSNERELKTLTFLCNRYYKHEIGNNQKELANLTEDAIQMDPILTDILMEKYLSIKSNRLEEYFFLQNKAGKFAILFFVKSVLRFKEIEITTLMGSTDGTMHKS